MVECGLYGTGRDTNIQLFMPDIKGYKWIAELGNANNTGIVVYLRDTWFGKLKIGNIK